MCNSAESREHHKTKARIYDSLNMFEEMSQSVKNMISADKRSILSPEERTLLSLSFKNSVDPDRHRFRQLNYLKCKQIDEMTAQVVNEVSETLKHKIMAKCDQLIDVVRSLLVIDQITDDNRVSYCKLLGDYLRYKAELKTEENQIFVKEANEAYERAHSLASVSLEPKNPNRLGNVLNYAVFKYEILGFPEEAIEFAKGALLEAENDDSLEPDSEELMSQLRDNIHLWVTDLEDMFSD